MVTKDFSNTNAETKFDRTNKDGATSYERIDTKMSPITKDRTNKDISMYELEMTEEE